MVRKNTKPSGADPKLLKLLNEPQGLINQAIEVYWEIDKAWYKGKITEIAEDHKDDSGKLKPHFINYEDGDQEWVDLKEERWRIFESEEDKKKKRKAEGGPKSKPKKQNADDKEEDDAEEEQLRTSVDTRGMTRKLITKTERVVVEKVINEPTIYEILLDLPGASCGDVKVRCGDSCVVIDCKTAGEKAAGAEEQENANGMDEKAPNSQQVVVIFPQAIASSTASAYMSQAGRLKVQVQAEGKDNEKGEDAAAEAEAKA